MLAVLGLLWVIGLAAGLVHFYSTWQTPSIAAWVPALTLHSILAPLWLLTMHPPEKPPNPSAKYWPYLPAITVLVGSLLAVSLSQLYLPSKGIRTVAWAEILVIVLWVPVCEEVVFRGVFSTGLRARLGPWLGGYLSALLFALVHSDASLVGWLEGRAGIPLGPFLLGLACELVYARTGTIAATIALHAACNTTGPIFAIADERWLMWLGLLYQ